MKIFRLDLKLLGFMGSLIGFYLDGFQLQTAQSQPTVNSAASACPHRSALERMQKHPVLPGETLAQIAQRYGLLSATLMGLNPSIRNGQVVPGQTLVVPPYNGILVSVPSGQTLQSIAQIYQVRPDVLFEVNGCPQFSNGRSPQVIFVPGINWSPQIADAMGGGKTAVTLLPTHPVGQVTAALRQDRYPLPQVADIKRPYGWQPQGLEQNIVFSSGVDLAARGGTSVYAVSDGIIAFAGSQKPWSLMVVVNHAQGRQTRYGYLGTLAVKVGQHIQRGQVLGTVGSSASALRFELRYRSKLGWIAQDPKPYLQAITPSKPQI